MTVSVARRRGDAAILLVAQIVATLLAFAWLWAIQTSAKAWDPGAGPLPAWIEAITLPAFIAIACFAPAFAFARRKGPFSVETRKYLARTTILVHVLIALVYAGALASMNGAGLFIVGALIVMPSALIAYATTRVGLHAGNARKASSNRSAPM